MLRVNFEFVPLSTTRLNSSIPIHYCHVKLSVWHIETYFFKCSMNHPLWIINYCFKASLMCNIDTLVSHMVTKLLITWRNIHSNHKFGLFLFWRTWQYRCYPLDGWSKSALGWIRIKIRIMIISWIGSYCRSFRKSFQTIIIFFKYKGVKS